MGKTGWSYDDDPLVSINGNDKDDLENAGLPTEGAEIENEDENEGEDNEQTKAQRRKKRRKIRRMRAMKRGVTDAWVNQGDEDSMAYWRMLMEEPSACEAQAKEK